MKKLFILAILFCSMLIGTLSAQVVETEMRMSAGIQSALEVDLKGDSKHAERLWKKYVKEIGKVEWDRKNREHLLFNVVVPDIDSDSPVSVYSKFSSSNDITKGTFWIKKDSEFINSQNNAEEVRGAGKWIQEYAYEIEKAYVSGLLKAEEKSLGMLEKNLNRLVKKNEVYHKNIEKAKAAISKAEQEIEQNVLDQEEKNKEIEGQKGKVAEVKKKLGNIGKN